MATSESENWGLIMEICDRVKHANNAKVAKDCLLALRKRLNHRDTHVIMLALSVCSPSSRASRASLLTVASVAGARRVHDQCRPALPSRGVLARLHSGAQIKGYLRRRRFHFSALNFLTKGPLQSVPPLAERTRALIKKWAKEECAQDASLSLIPALMKQLLADGYSFDTPPEKKVLECQFVRCSCFTTNAYLLQKQTVVTTLDPNYVSSKEEEDAIAKGEPVWMLNHS